MISDSKPLVLYQTFDYFEEHVKSVLPPEMVCNIRKYYIAQFSIYDECKVKINNDLFPTEVYRQLYLMKDEGLGDYKVGGSTALKLASDDNTWENDDVDIMVYTEMDPLKYAEHLGLTTLTKSWIKGIDPINTDIEERFHNKIYTVLTFQYNDFAKKIQLVFFDKFDNPSFTDFLDETLDFPAHVLYEVDFDEHDTMTHKFFLPIKMWDNILKKQIPRNLHCLKSTERIQKYIERGFKFLT